MNINNQTNSPSFSGKVIISRRLNKRLQSFDFEALDKFNGAIGKIKQQAMDGVDLYLDNSSRGPEIVRIFVFPERTRNFLEKINFKRKGFPSSESPNMLRCNLYDDRKSTIISNIQKKINYVLHKSVKDKQNQINAELETQKKENALKMFNNLINQ